MKIRLRLFVTLAGYLPAGSKGNEIELTIEENTTPLQVVDRLKIPFGPPLLIIVDGVKLTPEEAKTRLLREGETMAVTPPMSGG